jgi:predicted ATP-binding protein involved in virulence
VEYYITEIQIEELRHLSELDILLSQEKRTNLLLTGKNGSGKTTVLRAIERYFKELETGLFMEVKNLNGIDIHFNETESIQKLYNEGKFLVAFYSADRKIGITKQKVVEDVVLDTSYPIDSNPGKVLLKYLVHLKTQQAYARNEGDMEIVQMLDQWFERFVGALRVLLDNSQIQLKYDYKNYDFKIIENEKKIFGFDELSDGYSAAIQIVADLILRMEQNWLKKGILSSYDVEGIVLIDELETHLHIGLQKKILVFLTEFFPRVQFIVSTHSPYILNSIENCVIYDLEKGIRMENMSGYSAEGIVEGYFELDSYSETLLQKVKKYGELVEIQNPTDDERAERAKIYVELKQLSGDLSREAKNAFDEIENRRKQNDKI